MAPNLKILGGMGFFAEKAFVCNIRSNVSIEAPM